MKRPGFIKLLEKKGYNYKLVEDKIIITHYQGVYLKKVRTLPDNVVFESGSDVYLNDLESISPGTEFRNKGGVNLMLIKELPAGVFMNWTYLWTEGFNNMHWGCNIRGIGTGRILDLMIRKGII